MFNFDLSQDIEPFLLSHPSCKEFDIIQHLQAKGRLSKNVLATPLSLFRCHFLIFNALYRLQYLSLHHQRYQLSISSLSIQLSLVIAADIGHLLTDNQQTPDQQASAQQLDHNSDLGLFYLDLTQLNQTSQQDVNALLDSFWQQYFNPEQKTQALTTLQINIDEQAGIDFKAIKKQYRRLVMQHHPDRGGDASQLIAIQQAMQCLHHYYP